jgi:hypothetical protein
MFSLVWKYKMELASAEGKIYPDRGLSLNNPHKYTFKAIREDATR